MTAQKSKVIGYLRVSTIDQDTDKFRHGVLEFANKRNFGKVKFVSEKVSGAKKWQGRKLAKVLQKLDDGDIIITPELSRLGRNLGNVLEFLEQATTKGIAVYSVKENFQINGDDMMSKVLRTMLGLFAEIDNDIRSMRTKEGLQAARAKGQTLGRPKGSFSSKLDPHRDEIINLLKNGSTQTFIAKRYDMTPAAVGNWLKKHNLNNIKPDYEPKTPNQ